jgi:hypothetical protein
MLLATPKDDLLANIVSQYENDEFQQCAALSFEWGQKYPEDIVHAQACYSASLLAQGDIEGFLELAFTLLPKIESLSLKNLEKVYRNLLYLAINENRTNCFFLHSMANYSSSEAKRGWKIKCLVGAIGYTAGLFILPFNPALGWAILGSAGGIIFDGTLSALDEQDEYREQQKNHAKPNEFLSWESQGIVD